MFTQPYIRKLVLSVVFLNKADFIAFTDRLLLELKSSPPLMSELYYRVAKAYHSTTKYEQWMEARVTRKPEIRSRQLATECQRYFKFSPSMFPFLVKEAKKVRNRVLMRLRRSNAGQSIQKHTN